MRQTAWMLAGLIALVTVPAAAADADAAASNPDRLPWARWQGRLTLGTSVTPWRLGVERPGVKLGSASLMGDYYFGGSWAGASAGRIGGFRATSGLIFGPRGALNIGQPSLATGSAFSIFGNRTVGATPLPYAGEAPPENATLPYVGLGYTGLAARSGWSFSADLGLIAQSAGSAVRLGRVFSGGQSLDDAVRDMRLAPMLQFGVSYSF